MAMVTIMTMKGTVITITKIYQPLATGGCKTEEFKRTIEVCSTNNQQQNQKRKEK